MSAFGSSLLQRRADAVEVARHRDVEAGDLLAFGVEEVNVGLADLDADDVGAARRADDRVGDLRIGDQHVLDVARQIDHHRLADAERHEARLRLRADDLRPRRDGAPTPARPRARRGREHAREQPQRDKRRRVSMSNSPYTRPYSTHFGVVTVVTPKRTVLIPARLPEARRRRSAAWFRPHRRGCAAPATACRAGATARASRPGAA